MSKIITSVTMFNDAIGTRASITYSEVDDTTGAVTKNNVRFDRAVTNENGADAIKAWDTLKTWAQKFVDTK